MTPKITTKIITTLIIREKAPAQSSLTSNKVDLEAGDSNQHSKTDRETQGDESQHSKSKQPQGSWFKRACTRCLRKIKPKKKEKKEGDDNEEGSNKNINVQAAAIHIIGDTIQSFGVIIASIIIWINPNLHLADPICTFFFSVLVMFTTIKVTRKILRSLMEGVPLGFDTKKFEDALKAVPGVVNVHDFHIWALSSGKLAASAHISSTTPQISLKKATVYARKYQIFHSTFQVERSDGNDEDYKKICAHDLHIDKNPDQQAHQKQDNQHKKKKFCGGTSK